MGVNGWFLLSQVINILVLFVALGAFLWKPVLQHLDKRREMLEKEKEDADALAEARANIETERGQTLDQARGEADKILAEAREQAQALADQASQEARQKTDGVLAEAREAAEEERNRVLGEMRGQITSLAIAAAQKIVGETLDEKRQQALVESFFSGIREGRVEVLGEGVEAGPAGAPITVTSALPLTEKQQATVQKDLAASLGKESAIVFRVDPQILGGLTIRVGDRVTDGSVAGQLEQLHRSLS
jgi:F-type H+-transporting ATPase subunit b